MPVKSYKLGPGTLTLGAAPLDVSAQVRSLTVKVAEKVTRTDPIPVLSGEELAAEEDVTYEFTLAGTVIQDVSVGGLTDWSWTNKGTDQPFVFVPSTTEGRQATGTTVPVPLDFGGDVDRTKRPEAALSWRCPTEPVLGVVAP